MLHVYKQLRYKKLDARKSEIAISNKSWKRYVTLPIHQVNLKSKLIRNILHINLDKHWAL